MREKNVTRTFIVAVVEVSLYNKDTKEIEKAILKAFDIDSDQIEKWVAKQYNGFNVVVLETVVLSRSERKYTMSVEQFITYAQEAYAWQDK